MSALFFGSLGLCIDLFLIKSLGEEEYEKIFSSEKDIKSDAPKGIDIVDNITDEEKAHYEDIIKKDIEKESIEENKPEKKFDFFEKDTEKISDDNEPEPLSKPSIKEEIYKPFEETAENEKEHAKRFFSYLEGGMVEIQAAYPAGIIGNTLQNLKAAAAGENE